MLYQQHYVIQKSTTQWILFCLRGHDNLVSQNCPEFSCIFPFLDVLAVEGHVCLPWILGLISSIVHIWICVQRSENTSVCLHSDFSSNVRQLSKPHWSMQIPAWGFVKDESLWVIMLFFLKKNSDFATKHNWSYSNFNSLYVYVSLSFKNTWKDVNCSLGSPK